MSYPSEAQLSQARERLAKMEQQLQTEVNEELLQSDDNNTFNLADSVHDVGEESVANLLRDLNNALVNQPWQLYSRSIPPSTP